MTLTAINKTHQSKVNKAIKYLVKYNTLNNLRDKADNDGEEKTYRQLDRKCADVFDKYLDVISELPKREKINIETSKFY
jgi:hypothetical protein